MVKIVLQENLTDVTFSYNFSGLRGDKKLFNSLSRLYENLFFFNITKKQHVNRIEINPM